MKKIAAILVLCPSLLFAQEGMKFEHGLTWKQVQEKAKAENKYIFVDAYTTWCGPCTYMATKIFPQPQVGEFFNKNFVNVKVQLDTTAKDNDEVKSWYADGHNIMTQYKVNVFPTYLFFSPDGKLVHRSVGAGEAEAFITKGGEALNPEKQYYVLLDQYKAGKKDPAFLKSISLAAMAAYDMQTMSEAAEQYLKNNLDLTSSDDLAYIMNVTTSTSSKGFQLMLKNLKKMDKLSGRNAATEKVMNLVMREHVFPVVFAKSDKPVDWAALQAKVSSKYPTLADELISNAKVTYYQQKNDWTNFQKTIVSHMKKYGSKADDSQLNDFAWTVFENCADMNCVKEALAWSKRSFEKNNNPMFIDTYANILYKMGKKKEAIEWETKALALAEDSDKDSYKETLEKMKKGEKTWKN